MELLILVPLDNSNTKSLALTHVRVEGVLRAAPRK